MITPGTLTDTQYLDGAANNFLLAVHGGPSALGLALVDVSTGEFLVGEADGARRARSWPPRSCAGPPRCSSRAAPSPPSPARFSAGHPRHRGRRELVRTPRRTHRACRPAPRAHPRSLRAWTGWRRASQAAGAALAYLRETQGDRLGHLAASRGSTPAMPWCSTRRRWRRSSSSRPRRTARAAARWWPPSTPRARRWAPAACASGCCARCIDLRRSRQRQDAVDALVGTPRRCGRQLPRAPPSDRRHRAPGQPRRARRGPRPRPRSPCAAFLRALPPLATAWPGPAGAPAWRAARRDSSRLPELARLLDEALEDEPPRDLPGGGLIRESWSRSSGASAKRRARANAWIASLESARAAAHRDRHAARPVQPRLRLRDRGEQRPRGHACPREYVRRQTLAGAERYVTTELKEYESRVLGAEERIGRLELELFGEVRGRGGRPRPRALRHRPRPVGRPRRRRSPSPRSPTSAATCARVVDAGRGLEIVEGRHPVLETDRRAALHPERPAARSGRRARSSSSPGPT